MLARHVVPWAFGLVAVSTSVAATGCKVRLATSTRAEAPVAAPPPRAAAPRPEGYDEVRDGAPPERVEVDPQAAFLLRQGGATSADLRDGSTPTGLTAIALLDTTRAEARGFQPVGGLREVTLGEGQRASTPLDLATGECLTVVAHGGLGVREVDAFVVVGDAPDGDILAQDGGGGPIAVVGGQGGCTRVVKPEHVEVVVQVRKGRGSVIAAIFRGLAGGPSP